MDMVQRELSVALRATTHRKLCAEKGIPESEWGRWSALFSRVLKGYSVSARARNEVRVFLGLEPEMLPVPVLPCPTCGKVHTYNCGCEVVKPKQVSKSVRSKRKPRKRIDITRLVECVNSGELSKEEAVVEVGILLLKKW